MDDDRFAPDSFAFVARVDNGHFTYLASLGGLNSSAEQANCRGVFAAAQHFPPLPDDT
ncbi:hypothetical protein ACWC2T_33480 [Streptomyces sp. NPDC001393]